MTRCTYPTKEEMQISDLKQTNGQVPFTNECQMTKSDSLPKNDGTGRNNSNTSKRRG